MFGTKAFLKYVRIMYVRNKGTQYYSITLNVGTTILIAIYTFVVDKESKNVDSNNNNEQQVVVNNNEQ